MQQDLSSFLSQALGSMRSHNQELDGLIEKLDSENDLEVVDSLNSLTTLLHTDPFVVINLQAKNVNQKLTNLLKRSFQVQSASLRVIANLADNNEPFILQFIQDGILVNFKNLLLNEQILGDMNLIEQIVVTLKQFCQVDPESALVSEVCVPLLSYMEFFDNHFQHVVCEIICIVGKAKGHSNLKLALIDKFPFVNTMTAVAISCLIHDLNEEDTKKLSYELFEKLVTLHISAPTVNKLIHFATDVDFVLSNNNVYLATKDSDMQNFVDALELKKLPGYEFFDSVKLVQQLGGGEKGLRICLAVHAFCTQAVKTKPVLEAHEITIHAMATVLKSQENVEALGLKYHLADVFQQMFPLDLHEGTIKVLLKMALSLAKSSFVEQVKQSGLAECISEQQFTLDKLRIVDEILDIIATPDQEIDMLVQKAFEGDFVDFNILQKLPTRKVLPLLHKIENAPINSIFSLDAVKFSVKLFEKLEKFEVVNPLNPGEVPIIKKLTLQSFDKKLKIELNGLPAWQPMKEVVRQFKIEYVRIKRNLPRTSALNQNEPFVRDAERLKAMIFNENKVRLPLDMCAYKAHRGFNTSVFFVKVFDNEDEYDSANQFGGGLEYHPFNVSDDLERVLNILSLLAKQNQALNVRIPWTNFRSVPFQNKFYLQTRDINIIGAEMLPEWALHMSSKYPFLLPLSVRIRLVQFLSLNLENVWGRPQTVEAVNDDQMARPLGLYKRQRYQIQRKHVLETSMALLERSSERTDVLAIQYANELGFGRGPTQEFFSLASNAFSSMDTGMWIKTASGNLFPKPYIEAKEDMLKKFKWLGCLVSRALLDTRTLDLPFDELFFMQLLDLDTSINRIALLDPTLASSLRSIESASGEELNSMDLDFTVPGTMEELLPSGRDIKVNKDNNKDYIRLVCNFMLGSGIGPQLEAFKEGFDKLVAFSDLKCFTFDEMAFICKPTNNDSEWEVSSLKRTIKPGQGYSLEDPVFNMFLEVLSEFNLAERRQFLMFATGSPILPIGGFTELVPPFQVDVKYPNKEIPNIDDTYMPSVMTCAHFFRLPRYTSKEKMRSQLLKAFAECGSFEMS